MSDEKSLVSVGEISKPATVLVERIADAIGGVFKPYQIVRVARAEAEAEIIRAEAQIKIDGIHKRALHRFLQEEARKQANIEEITRRALPEVKENAAPEKLETDWITNFFDKCRLISDEQMQVLWSRTLAGEANNPGAFSKRTIDLLASLDKQDAELFRSLASFCWMFGSLTPLIFDEQDQIYNARGIAFNSLQHLESIGLIQFGTFGGFKRLRLPKAFRISYYGSPLELHCQNEKDNEVELGKVLLTRAGMQLAPICGSAADPAFYEYIEAKFRTMGLVPPKPEPAQPDQATQPCPGPSTMEAG
jgi:hypothetical protein